jgi:putative PIN family toxin of toxin-antitoxin system
MTIRKRVVFDTNVLVSRLLVPQSVPARAVHKTVAEDTILACDATLTELANVLRRRKFDPYVTVSDRQEFLRLFGRITVLVPIVHIVQACRDPKDDTFLTLAVNGHAELIITGDLDLLVLHPFRGIAIVTPERYLSGSSQTA